jgi:hypothetical protein
VLDVLVAEVSLHSPCIVAFVRQGGYLFPVEQEIHPLTKTNCRYDY